MQADKLDLYRGLALHYDHSPEQDRSLWLGYWSYVLNEVACSQAKCLLFPRFDIDGVLDEQQYQKVLRERSEGFVLFFQRPATIDSLSTVNS